MHCKHCNIALTAAILCMQKMNNSKLTWLTAGLRVSTTRRFNPATPAVEAAAAPAGGELAAAAAGVAFGVATRAGAGVASVASGALRGFGSLFG